MTMSAKEMGRKGGRAKTPAKVKAATTNLKRARQVLKALRRKLALDKTASV